MQGITQVRPVDPLLTTFGVECMNDQSTYITDEVAPIVKVSGDTGTYYVWEPRNMFAIESTNWSQNGGAPRVEIRATKDTFGCIKYGLEIAVTDDDRRNSLDPAGLERRAMNKVVTGIMLDRENRFATAINALSADVTLTTTKWGGGGGAAADPRGVVDLGKQTVLKNMGVMPNRFMIATDSYFDIVTSNAANSAGTIIKTAISYVMAVTANNINKGLLAQFWDIEAVIVSQAVKDTAVEPLTIGSASLGTGAYLWSNIGLLYYAPPNPSTETVSFYTSFSSVPFVADRYREERTESDILRGKQVLVEKNVCRKAGYLIKSLTT